MSGFEESSIPRHFDTDVQGEPVVTREPYVWKDGLERTPRPMDMYLPAVLEQLEDNQVIVVQAETGTGKTSRIPQAILDSDPEANIIMTQLTRPAVAWNGQYISKEMGSRAGGKVGWRLRGEDPVVSSETRCQLVIDQSLVNKVIADGRLPAGVLVIDEAHVRSIQTDLLLSLVKQYLPNSPDTKVVITSATIDTKKFQGFFNAPEPITAYNEHMHPIETDVVRLGKFEHHTEGAIRAMREHVLDRFAAGELTVQNAESPTGEREAVTQGSVLMLLPGKDDINQAMRQVQAHAKRLGIEDRVEVVQCHSQITPEERARVAADTRPGVLRIVCATDILRSSVTVPDTVGVVDSLQVKRKTVTERGVSHLAKITVSGAEADQGKGRAGREGPGFYIPISFEREYEHITNKQNKEYWPVPAIMRESLSSVTLQIAASGLDIRTLDMMDKPDVQKISVTLDRLKWIGALDDDGKITDLGRRLEKLTIDPERGRVLFEAAERGVLPEAIISMSVLENEGIFHTPGKNTDTMTVDREIMHDIHLRQLRSKSTWAYPAQTPEEVEETARTTIPSWAIPNSDGTYTLQLRGDGFPYEETPKSIAQKIIKRFAGDTGSDFCAVVQAARTYRAEEERLEAEYDAGNGFGNRERWISDRLRSWCFTNCINVKSMERTISSIRELTVDLRGSEFDLSTPPSEQREFSNDDLTKSMLLGLLDGIAIKDQYNQYVGPRGSGIVISHSSCSYSTNLPQVALCESVKKPDVPIRGVSYFSSMVAPIDTAWLEEVLPDLCATQIHEVYGGVQVRYDEEADMIHVPVQTVFNGLKLPVQTVEATGELATQAIAHLIYAGKLLPEVFDTNNTTRAYVQSLYMRAGDLEHYKVYEREYLNKWYADQLAGITSVKELREKVESGSINLALDQETCIPTDTVRDILERLPDQIHHGDAVLQVTYQNMGSSTDIRTEATIMVPVELCRTMVQVPSLLSDVRTNIRVTGSFGYVDLKRTDDADAIRAAVSEKVNSGEWSNFYNKMNYHVVAPTHTITDFASLPEVPPVQYGTDQITGNPLYAYVSLVATGVRNEYRERYHRTQEEAAKSNEQLHVFAAQQLRILEAAKQPELRDDVDQMHARLLATYDGRGSLMESFRYDYDNKVRIQKVMESIRTSLQVGDYLGARRLIFEMQAEVDTFRALQDERIYAEREASGDLKREAIANRAEGLYQQIRELFRSGAASREEFGDIAGRLDEGRSARLNSDFESIERELSEVEETIRTIDSPDAFTRIDTSTPAPTVDALRRQIESLLGWAEGMDKILLQTQLGSLDPDSSEDSLREAKVFVDGVAQRLPPPEIQNHTAVRVESKPRVFVTAPLEGDSIESLTEKVRDNAKKDPSLRRKAIAALAGRGLEGIEALERLGMTSTETLATVRKQEPLSGKAIDRYQLFTQGASLPVVREYLGEDASAISQFRRRLYEDISSREKVLDEPEIGEIVEGIIEDMTK